MSFVIELFRRHPAGAVFVWCFIKSIAPVPSPSLTALAGAAIDAPSARAAFAPILLEIALPGAAGLTLGGFALYELARRRGKWLLRRLGPKAGRQWALVQRARERLGGRRGSLIGGLRALPLVPVTAGAIAAGLLDAPAAEFAAWSFVGGVLRCLGLGYAGFVFKQLGGGTAASRWGASAAVAAAAAILGAALWLWLRPRAAAEPSTPPA